jgi:hypothetical protein
VLVLNIAGTSKEIKGYKKCYIKDTALRTEITGQREYRPIRTHIGKLAVRLPCRVLSIILKGQRTAGVYARRPLLQEVYRTWEESLDK